MAHEQFVLLRNLGREFSPDLTTKKIRVTGALENATLEGNVLTFAVSNKEAPIKIDLTTTLNQFNKVVKDVEVEGKKVKLTFQDDTTKQVDFAQLATVAVTSTGSVTVEGNGSAENPVKATVKVSAAENNAVVVKDDGLYVENVKNTLIFRDAFNDEIELYPR